MSQTLSDIRTRRDIEVLVSTFYGEVREDQILGDLFARQIGDDWAGHEARVCDFWENILLGGTKFKGRSLLGHLEVDEMCTLCPYHFHRWCELFEGSVQRHFHGACADRARCRAKAMSESLQSQLTKARGCPLASLSM